MVICPNCGHSVADSQRFCGNCGADVQAALAHAAPRGTPISDNEPAPYAYAQPMYGQEYQPVESGPKTGRFILIGAIALIAMCCVFACGLALGFEIIPDLLGIGGASGVVPSPVKATPTPQSLLPIVYWLIG